MDKLEILKMQIREVQLKWQDSLEDKINAEYRMTEHMAIQILLGTILAIETWDIQKHKVAALAVDYFDEKPMKTLRDVVNALEASGISDSVDIHKLSTLF